MTTLALSAATVTFPDPTFANFAWPTGTAVSTNTTITFPNSPDGLVCLAINVGSTATTYSVTGYNGDAGLSDVEFYSSVWNLIGPFDPALYSGKTGLVTVTLSQTTGLGNAAVVILPAPAPLVTMRALHNPFETGAGYADS